MSERLRAAFLRQSESCAGLGSPFMGRLMALFGERLAPGGAVADRLLGWEGDVGSNGHSVPLRIAGALHGLVLDGTDRALAAVYPPHAAGDDALWTEVSRAIRDHADRLMGWLDHAPQTNEVRRSVALIPAMLFTLDRFDRPLRLTELGASAGLNLGFPDYGLTMGTVEVPARRGCGVHLAPRWKGDPPPWRHSPAPVREGDRAGVDLNPLDVSDPDGRLRLLAYLWPDQPDRRALSEAAIAWDPPRPEAGDALPFLRRRLARPEIGTLRLVCHTIAWQYFPTAMQAACRAALEQAGDAATDATPLAWIGMEADGNATGAALTLRLWPGNETWSLARVDFHGRWIDWAPERIT